MWQPMTWDYVGGALTAALLVGGFARWRAGFLRRERARLEALVAERTRELRASEAKFRGIFEDAVEGIYQSSLDGHNLAANPAMAQLCGYDSPEEMRGAVTDVASQFYVQPGRRAEVNARLEREGVLVGCESEIRRRDGSTLWVSENVRLLRDAATGRSLYLGSIVDITQKRLAEAELRAVQRRLSLLVRETPLAVIEFDRDARVTAWNPAAERIFGHPAAEALGQTMQTLLLTEEARAFFPDIWAGYRRGDGNHVAVTRSPTKSGRVILCECYCTPLHDDHGEFTGVASFALDVTEREQAQERLRAATDAAEAANRAKTTFLANMSHELRTPLNGILGFVRVMRRDPAAPERFRERLAIVDSSGEQLLHLINEVLDLSKIEAGKMELQPGPCSLPGLLMGLADVFGLRATEKSLAFVCELDPATVPAMVRADEPRLRQVLTNLLDNAFKFTDHGAVELRVSGGAGGERVRFEVRDTGIGIAPDQQGEIFQPFHQLPTGRGGRQGTGLGLGISRFLVELMGGELRVESAPGRGSRFHFDLALPVTPSPAVSQVRPQIAGYKGPPRRVLVVDDDPVNRSVARELFAQVGFQVREAGGGQECLDIFPGFAPHLILLDLRMAPMDGFETARRLRQADPARGTRILASSAGTLTPPEQERISTDCNGFHTKPLDVDRLFGQVADLLGMTWTFHDPAPGPTPVFPGKRALPSQEEIETLLAFARQGDVVKLRARLRAVPDRDGEPAPFYEEIATLAAGFELGRITRTLEEARAVLAGQT